MVKLVATDEKWGHTLRHIRKNDWRQCGNGLTFTNQPMAVKHDVMQKAQRAADSIDDGMYEDVLFTTCRPNAHRVTTHSLRGPVVVREGEWKHKSPKVCASVCLFLYSCVCVHVCVCVLLVCVCVSVCKSLAGIKSHCLQLVHPPLPPLCSCEEIKRSSFPPLSASVTTCWCLIRSFVVKRSDDPVMACVAEQVHQHHSAITKGGVERNINIRKKKQTLLIRKLLKQFRSASCGRIRLKTIQQHGSISAVLSRGQQGGLTKTDAVLSNIRLPAVMRESCRSACINRKCQQRAERRLRRKHSLLSACYLFCSMCTLLICGASEDSKHPFILSKQGTS